MKSWQQQIEIISYSGMRVMAAVLICFGVGLLISSVTSASWSKQLASTLSLSTDYTVSSSTSFDSSGSGSNTTSTISPIESSVSFVSSVPDKVSTNFDVAIMPIAVTELKLTVNGLSLDKTILLQPVHTQSSGVIFSVPVSQLPVGKYELRAFGYRSDGTKLYVAGPRFEVISTTLNETTIATTTTTTSGSGSGDSIASTANIGTSTEVDSTQVEIQDVVTEPEIKDLTLEPVYVSPNVKVILPIQNSYRNFVPIQISTSVRAQEISVYVRSSLKTQMQFIGKARYYDTGQWLLMVDTNQILNGEYRLFAIAKLNDVDIESDPQRFVVYNSTVTTDSSIKNTTVTSESKPESIKSEAVKLNIINPVPEPVILPDELKVLVPRVLKEFERPINVRLREYSEAVRSTSELSLDGAKKAENDIMAILLEDSRLSSVSPETKQRLQREVVRQVKNAGRVEQLLARKDATKQKYEDFIHDLSEATVIPEDTMVDVSSPREFGLVREDILKIESVSPIVAMDTVSTSTTIYTEIRGRALPNSLVTLYIYSSPVMVTVQTDADGTFVYVYEKDLSDGNHEVYVALTTTAGAVAAKSEGFQFVREAEAFGTPDVESGDILEPVTTATPLTSNPYFIVLSFSILVFGLVLLFLGLKAGKKPEEIIEVQ